MYIFYGFSWLLIAIVAYNVAFRGASVVTPMIVGGVSFLLGHFIFSKMNRVEWNMETGMIQAVRMDAAGAVILVLYILYEISLHVFFDERITPLSATFSIPVAVLAGVAGVLLGRGSGMTDSINRLIKTVDGQQSVRE